MMPSGNLTLVAGRIRFAQRAAWWLKERRVLHFSPYLGVARCPPHLEPDAPYDCPPPITLSWAGCGRLRRPVVRRGSPRRSEERAERMAPTDDGTNEAGPTERTPITPSSQRRLCCSESRGAALERLSTRLQPQISRTCQFFWVGTHVVQRALPARGREPEERTFRGTRVVEERTF